MACVTKERPKINEVGRKEALGIIPVVNAKMKIKEQKPCNENSNFDHMGQEIRYRSYMRKKTEKGHRKERKYINLTLMAFSRTLQLEQLEQLKQSTI